MLYLEKVCRSEGIGKCIEMNWRTSEKLVTLRCTSDLGADDTASALPRNGGGEGGGGRRRGFDPCVWPIPTRHPPLSNRTRIRQIRSRGKNTSSFNVFKHFLTIFLSLVTLISRVYIRRYFFAFLFQRLNDWIIHLGKISCSRRRRCAVDELCWTRKIGGKGDNEQRANSNKITGR